MNSCKLCITKEADKTGSHIIPHFLMKRIDNETGKTGRNKELGFVIGEMETTSYFGQSVLPEKLNQVFGELSDKEIENNKIPTIEDHIFCSECEEKLAQIESEYSKTLENNDVDSKIRPEIALLFWISIIWRVSISKKQSLILKTDKEELLRRILNKYLAQKIEDINFEAIKQDSECLNLSYRLIRCPDYSEKEATYLFCHPSHKMPYCILLDEYVLFFYFKKGHIDTLIQSFFGFEKDLKGKSVNTLAKGENKIIYDKKAFKDCLSKLVNLLTDRQLDYYNTLFDEAYKRMGAQGDKMPANIKKSIISRIIFGESNLGRRYTAENIIKSMIEEMKIHKA